MKLKKFIEQLQEFVKENPETVEMEVIYSHDDEGNCFQPVYFGPSKGYFEDNSFLTEDSCDEEDEYPGTNSVCIN
jgi:hypothetical protein